MRVPKILLDVMCIQYDTKHLFRAYPPIKLKFFWYQTQNTELQTLSNSVKSHNQSFFVASFAVYAHNGTKGT